MFGSSPWINGFLLALIVGQHQVIGQECGSVVITSQADADALRNCPEIFGNVTVITGASAQEIALEGVKVIHGDLVNVSQCPQVSAQCIGYNHNITSISSSTITRVNGSILLAYDGWISGLSFPELQSVGENFVLHSLESLKYLDVDRLESVGYMRLMYAPKLTNLKLSAFRNITGITNRDGSIDGRSMELGLGGLESLDAFFKEPQLGVDDVSIYNSGKVKRLQIGAAKIGTVKFAYSTSGKPNNLTLVLGGSGITEQTIGSIQTTYSLNGIERLVNLKTLSVGSFSSFGANFYQHLDLPFDHLGNLTIRNERELVWLSVPPQAEQWEDFSLDIGYNPNLNLSTEYRVSEKGEMIRSWYWPRPNMGKSYLRGNLSKQFFDSYFEFRNKLSKEALANRTEYLQVYAEGSFSCEPFDKLEKKASGQYRVVCSAQDRIDLRSGGLVQAKLLTFGWIVAGVIVITGIISV
ncbi:hypothetical protein CPAR01_09452 [Colletotrichum paranaense]|uniref:Uncharacterized protein n=2 Tax=Colletotrichum acutatum species complex TaxID=2707335 RepID=A0ABQ9SGT1_9PEZI|nr:uncharacterized protein CPAR01_09452 [Colletotrichum paranaense]KAK1535910.1 hypothetical protein CPAR01_09452 [Colletotrichum paranaense]